MLTYSTGYGGRLVDRLGGLWRQSRRLDRIAQWDFSSFESSRSALERYVGRPLRGARVLDLGCGQRFPALLLFHTSGARATGIDTDVVDPEFSVRSGLRMLRENGIERFLSTFGRHLLFDRAYYRELRQHFRAPLRFGKLDVRKMDARSLAFPDGEFDLVHSTSAFEHFADVPGAVSELCRVLRPDGVASVVVHLFPSLSGGHELEWAFPDEAPSRRVPPWDHLRENRFPSHAYLNRWRGREYQEAFGRHFETLEFREYREGERLLTPELERSLEGFTRDELLTRAFRAVLRKK
jgi:SAM-dependent methyltransferase